MKASELKKLRWIQNIADEHESWLADFEEWRIKTWQRTFKGNPESAVCEALTRTLFASLGGEIRPQEKEDVGGPDYWCKIGGAEFYVEATSLSIDSVTKETWQTHEPTMEVGSVGTVVPLIKRACTNKAKQLSALDLPGILVVGTLHWNVSAFHIADNEIEWVLTDNTYLAVPFPRHRGEKVPPPYEATNLRNSAFIRPSKAGTLEAARHSISAILYCGFGVFDSQTEILDIRRHVKGALNPYAIRPFPYEAIPQIQFCQLHVDPTKRTVATSWTS